MRRRKNFEADFDVPINTRYGGSRDKFYLSYQVKSMSYKKKSTLPPLGVFGPMSRSFAEKTIANIAKILVEACGDWEEDYDPFNSDFITYTSLHLNCAKEIGDKAIVMLDNREAIVILLKGIVGSFTILGKDVIDDYLSWKEYQWVEEKARPYDTEIYERQNTPFEQAIDCLLYNEMWSLGWNLRGNKYFQDYIIGELGE